MSGKDFQTVSFPPSAKPSAASGRRSASHAGSWYAAAGRILDESLDKYLSKVDVVAPKANALIAPHAGYAYCGACAAYAYKQVDSSKVKRIFILGPSHHVPMSGCAVTKSTTYETPLYDLKVDLEVTAELLATGKFDEMNLSTDEDEHSIEMHLPFIAKVMQKRKDTFTIVPVLVGSTSHDKELMYGKIFSKYLESEENLFVISSDFCHWGKRFRYTYYDESKGDIHQSIEHLDKMGMQLIENLDTSGFYQYLERYSNTICGRHPIGIFLNAVDQLPSQSKSFKFHKYAQSCKCSNKINGVEQSSVSYAAGTFTWS